MDTVFARVGALVEPVAGALAQVGLADEPARFIAGTAVICVIAIALAGVWALGSFGVRKALGTS